MRREDFAVSDEKPSVSTASSDSGVIVEDGTKDEQQKSSPQIEISIENERTKSDTIKNSDNCKIESIKDEDESHSSISTNSDRSHHISIVSLDDDAESSVIDSDSDFEDVPEQFIQKLGQHTTEADRNGLIMINQQLGNEGTCIREGPSTSKPQIGSIAVQNSTDITFGNKTFYQGPVTIKQFLVENKKWRKSEGTENAGFETDESKPTANGFNKKTDLDNSTQKKLVITSKPICITGTLIIVSIVICAVTFTLLSFTQSGTNENKPGDGDDSRKNIPINSTIGDDNIEGGRVLRYVTRDEWVAQPANSELTALELPTERVIITHTATEGCDTQASCVFRVRFIQTFHMESRGWDDIAYNFLVGGDGSVYEGRGWDKQGAHTKGYNVKSIGIAFVGTFIKNLPPKKQLRAAQLIIAEGVRLGKLDSNYKLYGHRQLIPSESPGEALYNIIKTWPHWTDQV